MTSNKSVLTVKEKKVLNKSLTQTLAPIIIYAIVLLAVCTTTIIGLNNVNSIYNTTNVRLSIFVIPFILFFLISYKTVIPLVKDLFSKEKCSMTEVIIDKKTNTNYGWTGNPIENQINKPYFTENYLIFKNSQIDIDKNTFDKLNIGDEITVSKSLFSNITLGVV